MKRNLEKLALYAQRYSMPPERLNACIREAANRRNQTMAFDAREYKKRRLQSLVKNLVDSQREYVEALRDNADGQLVEVMKNAYQTNRAILLRYCYGLIGEEEKK